MNPSHFLYNLAITGVAPLIVPGMWLYQRSRQGQRLQLQQRLGIYSHCLSESVKRRPGGQTIWLHAASVGEVGVAAAVVRSLRQQGWQDQIILSTTTLQGLSQASALFTRDVTVIFAPLDWWPAVNRALKMVQPDVLAILETEIWPNLLVCARRRGVHTAILNGRISLRTVNRYRRIGTLMRHVLSQVELFSMISENDARRIRSMGAPPDRILVQGNAKFDAVDPLAEKKDRLWAQALFGLVQEDRSVFVAGSTRDPEEHIVLDAFGLIRQVEPRTLLIIAPRHMDRCDQIEKWIRARGLICQRRTRIGGTEACGRKRATDVVLLDSIGELSATYSIASFVFCGGSLVPKGGQNLLEPALWGKPIMYGPSMEDFAQARELIEGAGGGVRVENAQQMAQTAIDWLLDPPKALQAGRAGRRAILAHRGSAGKHVRALLQLLE